MKKLNQSENTQKKLIKIFKISIKYYFTENSESSVFQLFTPH